MEMLFWLGVNDPRFISILWRKVRITESYNNGKDFIAEVNIYGTFPERSARGIDPTQAAQNLAVKFNGEIHKGQYPPKPIK